MATFSSEYHQNDLRQKLATQLVERCRKNPRYSLRAFAKSLDMEPSFVSKLLRGERNFTENTCQKISERLGIELLEDSKQKEFNGFANEAVEVMTQWHYFAILELLLIPDFSFQSRRVASALGISPIEAEESIQRLKRLGLIQKKENKWSVCSPDNTTYTGTPTSAQLRNLQKSFLEKALQALEEVPIESRDQSAMTMAVDSKLMPEIKTKIRNFRRDLCKFAQENRSCNEVYQLTISFFPLTTLRSSHVK